MCAFLNWMMRSISEVEMYFNNIERIVQYAEIESEPYHMISGTVCVILHLSQKNIDNYIILTVNFKNDELLS